MSKNATFYIRNVNNGGDHSLGNGATQLPASGNLPEVSGPRVVCWVSQAHIKPRGHMRKSLKITAAFVGLLVLCLCWLAWQLYAEVQKTQSEDPVVWEEAVSALESKTRGLYGPGEGVVFIGSSSIRLWDTLADDMAPLPVIRMALADRSLTILLSTLSDW